ncbi:MAG: folate family ECF transporter S component [Tissierellia bacterium]|nr:folate family ECF transporter S component [Tissierellia bacterium]
MKAKKRKMDIRTVVKAGFLVAISIVMTRFVSIMIPIGGAQGLRVSFGEVPIILSGFMFGPLVGGITGVAADILGMLINPQGPYYPGFTISSMLWGTIPGLLTYIFKRNSSSASGFSVKFIAIIVAITYIIVAMILNTYWLSNLYGTAFFILLPVRFLNAIVSIPVTTIVLNVLLKQLRRFD